MGSTSGQKHNEKKKRGVGKKKKKKGERGNEAKVFGLWESNESRFTARMD